MMFYGALWVHSWLRWWLLVVGGAVTLRAISRFVQNGPWSTSDRRAARLFVGSADLQLLVGLTLLFDLSPTAKAAWANLGAALADPHLAFFGVLHPLLMLTAVVVLHVGWVAARRAEHDRARHRRFTAGSVAAFVLLLLSIPWPFLPYGRTLFRIP